MNPKADAISAPLLRPEDPMVQSGYLPFPGLLQLELTPNARAHRDYSIGGIMLELESKRRVVATSAAEIRCRGTRSPNARHKDYLLTLEAKFRRAQVPETVQALMDKGSICV